MLTLSYLKNTLQNQVNGIVNLEKQVIESAGGYDGILSLVQSKGISPVIILENSEVGEFSFRPGGFLNSSQSIWVMKMVGRDEDKRIVQDECFAIMKRILSIFSKRNKDEELKDWEWDRIPFGVRNAGANFTGYEFTMYFSEDTDLEYHAKQ